MSKRNSRRSLSLISVGVTLIPDNQTTARISLWVPLSHHPALFSSTWWTRDTSSAGSFVFGICVCPGHPWGRSRGSRNESGQPLSFAKRIFNSLLIDKCSGGLNIPSEYRVENSGTRCRRSSPRFTALVHCGLAFSFAFYSPQRYACFRGSLEFWIYTSSAIGKW